MSEHDPSVYLAGPITHADDYGVGWREYISDKHDGYEFQNPFEIVDVNENDISGGVPVEVMDEDLEVLYNCDAVIGYLPIDVPTRGTAVELWEAGKEHRDIFVIVIIDSPQHEYSPAVRGSVDVFVQSIDEAITELESRVDT